MQDLKNMGNDLFKLNKFNEAIEKYTEALELTEDTEDVDKNKSILHSNISATYCKLEDYGKALDHAAIATKLNNNWFKAWYRLSFVLHKLEKFEQAKKSIDKTIELCKENGIVENYIKDLEKDIYKLSNKDEDTEDEDDPEPKINIDNNLPNVNSLTDVNNFMPIMDNILNNSKIKEKLDDKDFQQKIMENQNNPFAMLSDPDMKEIMKEMMISMSSNK